MKLQDLIKAQNELRDICYFLGFNKCSKNDYETKKCLHGDYTLCSNYYNLVREFVDEYSGGDENAYHKR